MGIPNEFPEIFPDVSSEVIGLIQGYRPKSWIAENRKINGEK
jgi:hypothetical protein